MNKKISIGIITFFIIMLMTTVVHAAPPGEFDWVGDGQGAVATTQIGGYWILCIEKGGSLKTTTYTGSPYEKGYNVQVCPNATGASAATAPTTWSGIKYQSHFTNVRTIPITEHQDARYALIHGSLDEAQSILWALSINQGRHIDYNSAIAQEAKAYGEFYNKVQAAGGYKPKDTTNYNNVKVYGDYNTKIYTSGPYSIDYLDDNVRDYEVRFGEIIDLQVKNEKDERLNVVKLVDKYGNDMATRPNYHYPHKDEEFYVQFKSNNADGTKAGDTITLDVEFNYLKECTGTLYEYEGEIRKWQWTITNPTHDISKTCSGPGDGETTCSHNETGSHAYSEKCKDTKYVLDYPEPDKAQQLLAYARDGQEIWERVKLKMVYTVPNPPNPPGPPNPPDNPPDNPPGLKITMNLSGYVFLDKDSGKINEGDYRLGQGELLQGVKVTLYEASGSVVQQGTTHRHSGDSSKYGGCFTLPIYHVHTDACYSAAPHTHTGDSVHGGGCYTTPVYHIHSEECYLTCGLDGVPGHTHTSACYDLSNYKLVCNIEENHIHNNNCRDSYGNIICGQPEGHRHSVSCYDLNTIVGTLICSTKEHIHEASCHEDSDFDKDLTCTKTEHRHSISCYRQNVHCNKTGSSIEYYKLNCTQSTSRTLICGKTENDIDCWGIDPNISCSMQNSGSITTALQNPVITGADGYYEFIGIDAMKKYYVTFEYNGMLYSSFENFDGTKVLTPTGTSEASNLIDASKASEHGQGNNTRTPFNNTFTEIGSYPTNYNSPSKGTWNTVFPQDEVKDEVISAIAGNSPGGDKGYFAQDCVITSYTQSQYPLTNKFSVDDKDHWVPWDPGTEYPGIYKPGGKADQLNVDLGIKCRPTFDLALYKDVYKADVRINEKTETYTYDSRKASVNDVFGFGVREEDYLTNIREAYINGSNYTFSKARQRYEDGSTNKETDDYDLLVRSEEAANANSSKYSGDVNGKVPDNFQVKDNTELTGEDRLKIYVTYKIRVKNQSSVTGGVTEIVDYYDKNYVFTDAYVGDDDGNKIGDVTSSTSSMYGGRGNNEYTNSNKYKTIYLKPNNIAYLNNNDQQYIYVTLQLLGETENDAGTLLTQRLINTRNGTLTTLNLVEINGYNTSANGEVGRGVIDKDSTPGNFDMRGISSFVDSEVERVNPYEDDTNRAPAYVYKLMDSRTMEGIVFEDNTGLDEKVYSGKTRAGNGQMDTPDTDTRIKDVTVQLIEIKNGKMYIRSETKTNSDGWYGFTGFVPGEYTIRYIYGHDNDTAMNTSSYFADGTYKGSNVKSYNGQDFQSTHYGYDINSENQYEFNSSDQLVNTGVSGMTYWSRTNGTQNIPQFNELGGNTKIYWYAEKEADIKSDAYDNHARRNEVIKYSTDEIARLDDTYARNGDNVSIVNHKAEVFNSYEDRSYYGENYYNYFPTMNDELHKSLAEELKDKTYRYAYTPQMSIEVEKATTQKPVYQGGNYPHQIKNVDFGIVERPKAELTIDQDIDGLKIVLANGATLIDTKKGASSNVRMPSQGQLTIYDKGEDYTINIDDELLSGATLQVTYNITLTNNSEIDTAGNATLDTITSGMIVAKNIVNYVPNNLTFEASDNDGLNGEYWKVTSVDNIQKNNNATLVNSRNVENKIDISTQTTTLMATPNNPLVKKWLTSADYNPNNGSSNAYLDKEVTNPDRSQVTAQLTLKKLISTESSGDDKEFYNITEVVEYNNGVGRYDHGAIPGNQNPDLSRAVRSDPAEGGDEAYKERFLAFNFEHDTSGGEDGRINITPPTGEFHIYYIIIAVSIVMLVGGIILIKKKVLNK